MISVILGATTSATASPDGRAFAGRWTLQPTLSQYESSMPQSMEVTIELTPRGVHYRSTTRQPTGRAYFSEFTASLEGTPALVVGSAGFWAPVTLRLQDEFNIDATYTGGPRTVATSRWTLNPHKGELRITTTSRADGLARLNLAVFTRSPEHP